MPRTQIRHPIIPLRCSTAGRWAAVVLAFAARACATGAAAEVVPDPPAAMLPLSSVRLLDGSPFAAAVKANRDYLLALDPDRLLAPFRREAGLPAKAQSYGNWESGGLDGHTAGHYLSALVIPCHRVITSTARCAATPAGCGASSGCSSTSGSGALSGEQGARS